MVPCGRVCASLVLMRQDSKYKAEGGVGMVIQVGNMMGKTNTEGANWDYYIVFQNC